VASYFDEQALASITVEQAEAISAQRAINRRKFLRGVGLTGAAAAGVGLLSACGNGSNGATSVMAQAPSETDVLNFALNLEFLEATFYSFVTQGIDLPSSLITGSGAITGAPAKITFPNQQITDIFNEIFFNEMSHVADLQSVIGSGHVQRPALNLAAAGPVTSANVITISRQFEDVGTTAYAGAVPALTGTNLAYAAQILAVEGFQAGAVRLIAIQLGVPFAAADALDVPTADPGAAALASGGPNATGGFFATSGTSNASATVPAALAFTRSTSQVLQIVYGAAGQTGVSSGGFFPNGLNGNIKTS
jgi:ferritin-like protein